MEKRFSVLLELSMPTCKNDIWEHLGVEEVRRQLGKLGNLF